jgi:molybdopterin synthase catalytic subunit
MTLPPLPKGDTWVGVTADQLPLASAMEWASGPGFGAVVTFSGTVRDNSEGRPGVVSLEYEAFEGPAERLLGEVAADARLRWPTIGRVALLHRVGVLVVTETSVLVVVSSPHRDEAFEAARFCIDLLKRTIPVWKKETWAGGSDWSQCAHAIEPVGPATVDASSRGRTDTRRASR